MTAAPLKRLWAAVVFVGILAGGITSSTGEEMPPLWLAKAAGANEILVFKEIRRGRDGRGYVLVSEAKRISARATVKAAAGELVRADYDLIVPVRFGFNLGAHIFINKRGEPLVAVDTTGKPPALAVSRPYQDGDKIFLGTTRDTRETISMGYYRHLSDLLEGAVPELSAIARRALSLPAGSRLRDGFPPGDEK